MGKLAESEFSPRRFDPKLARGFCNGENVRDASATLGAVRWKEKYKATAANEPRRSSLAPAECTIENNYLQSVARPARQDPRRTFGTGSIDYYSPALISLFFFFLYKRRKETRNASLIGLVIK